MLVALAKGATALAVKRKKRALLKSLNFMCFTS
jgi:hypothetical protein